MVLKNPKAVLVSSRSGRKSKDSSKPLYRRKKRCAEQTDKAPVKAPSTQAERNVSKQQRTLPLPEPNKLDRAKGGD